MSKIELYCIGMKGKLKLMLLAVSVLGTGMTGYYLWQCKAAFDSLPPMAVSESASHGEEKAGGHGQQAASGHGAAPAGEHGAPAAGGHGEPAPAAGGHGAPAGGHGEAAPAAGGHGEAARAPASRPNGLPLFSIDELYVNVSSPGSAHTLGLKLELELFDESSRALLDSRQAGIRNKIIETAREQEFFRLNTLGGKLYFKELLVGKLNEFFGNPLIKSIHFSSFYLQ